LLYALRRLQDDAERDRLPLPMARLARFGLNRNQLRQRSDARDQAVKAQLVDLQAAWREVDALPGPLSVFRGLESRHDAQLAQRAVKTADPLAVLQQAPSSSGLGITFAAWRHARAWRRMTG
jgi:phytoene synthase